MPPRSRKPAIEVAVVDEDDHGRPLTAQQRIAAFLEAGGRTRREITEVVDVSEKTISRWRSRDDYQALIVEFQSKEVERISRGIDLAYLGRLEGGSAARTALRDLLTSESPSVVLEAATQLLNDETVVLAMAAKREAAESSSGAAAMAGAVIKVVISQGEGDAGRSVPIAAEHAHLIADGDVIDHEGPVQEL